MSEIIKAEAISRRSACSFFGKAAAFAMAASATALVVASDAEAQTAGMTRRQERRTGRHERRNERRTGAIGLFCLPHGKATGPRRQAALRLLH